jgi:hypothetical protein
MQKLGTIDFARLLGFDTVAGDAEKNLDLRNETISDRLGAKIGPIEPTIAVDFRDDTMGAKLGAGVGAIGTTGAE